MIVQLFSNRASGGYRPRRVAALVRALEAAGATVIAGDCRAPIAAEAERICIAGGDGAARDVLAALAASGRSVPVGIYPLGTVNLVAAEAGYARSPARFVRRLLGEAAARDHHVAQVGGGLMLACAGAGPDSAAIARLSLPLKRRIGRLAYLVAFLGVLRDWPRPRISLKIDEELVACEAFYVAKGRYFAGRWSFAPAARLDNASLHVVTLATARRRDFTRFAWAMLLGRDVARLPGVRRFACTALSAAADRPTPLQADGDIVAALPVTIALAADPVAFV